MWRKLKGFSLFSISYTGNTEWLPGCNIPINSKKNISKKEKGVINCFSNKTACWASPKYTESLKVELIFPGFHTTLFLPYLYTFKCHIIFKNHQGKQNLIILLCSLSKGSRNVKSWGSLQPILLASQHLWSLQALMERQYRALKLNCTLSLS